MVFSHGGKVVFHRLVAVGVVLLATGGLAVADEYKDAKIVKSGASGETTIEATVKGKKVTAKIWPYVKMTTTDANGKKVAPADAFEEGNVIDVTTSKTIVKDKEVTVKLVVKEFGKKKN
jgi:hypothetical protein